MLRSSSFRAFALASRCPLAANSISRSFASASSDNYPHKSFARGCFLGKLQTSEIFPYPDVLDADQKETLKMLIEPAEKFFQKENDAYKNDEKAQISDETWTKLKEMGACGMQVPSEYGGLGLSNTAYARMGEILGAYDLGISVALGAHQSIGFKGIMIVGNEAQKAKYLPKLATGELMAAFCLTEPSTGSDANSVQSRATLSPDGKHWILNGSKIWISNGGIAEIFTVFAQTPCKDKDGKPVDKITAFIVERSFGGLTHGAPENKMGIKCSNTAEVYFDNVKIPVENVLGEVGGGFKVAMMILNSGRFGMGSALAGTQRVLIKKATDHAVQRVQFKQTIKNFELIQEKLAVMATKCYASESMAYILSANMDRGSKDYQLEAAMGKIYSSEAAWNAADETIQILGGMGFMKGTGVERIMRDLRIFRIFEGTNDILRMFISLTGLQSTGEVLSSVKKNPFGQMGVVKEKLSHRLGLGEKGIQGAHAQLSKEAGLVASLVSDFDLAAITLVMRHGKKVVDHQMSLRRLADAAIGLYAMAACISRCSRSIERNTAGNQHELLLTKAFCKDTAIQIRTSLKYVMEPEKTCNKAYSQIAKELCDAGEYIPVHPLGL